MTTPRQPPASSLYQALDARLNGQLADILTRERTLGATDRGLSILLHKKYGLKVSHMTVRKWCDQLGLPRPEKYASLRVLKTKTTEGMPKVTPGMYRTEEDEETTE